VNFPVLITKGYIHTEAFVAETRDLFTLAKICQNLISLSPNPVKFGWIWLTRSNVSKQGWAGGKQDRARESSTA